MAVSRRTILSGAASFVAASTSGTLRANDGVTAEFLTGPVHLVVPFPPGSGTDLVARAFAKAIGDLIAQPVVVENKPGANGVIAVRAVLKAPADGRTIFMGSNSTLSTNAAVMRNLPYDPLRDLAPISIMGRGACVVIVPSSSPYTTLSSLVASARLRPETLNYGSGSASYTLYTEWFNELSGIKARSITYKGAPEVNAAVAGGQVDYAVSDATASQVLINSGRLRALLISDTERSEALPNVPTAAEAGLPTFIAYNWTGAAVSAHTPAPVVRQIEALYQQAGNAKGVRDLFARTGLFPVMSTAAQMKQFQTQETDRWMKLAAKIGLQIDQ